MRTAIRGLVTRTATSAFLVLALACGAHAQAQMVPIPTLINEADADQTGTDAGEFVELYGNPGASLDGFVVVFFNGSSDLSYAAFDLDGFSLDANGFFVLGNAGVANVGLEFAGNLLQNGADAVALYLGNAVDFPLNTALTTANLQDALVYDTADPDDPGLLALLLPGQPQIDENGTASGITVSMQRCPDGGALRETSSYALGTPTPGITNACTVPVEPNTWGTVKGLFRN